MEFPKDSADISNLANAPPNICYCQRKILFTIIIVLIVIIIVLIVLLIVLLISQKSNKKEKKEEIIENKKEILEIKEVNFPEKSFSDIINLINNANDGDTVRLNGYYYWNGSTININKRITIIGDDNTILDAKSSSQIFNIYSSNVTIKNIKLVNGSYSSGGAIYWTGDNGILSNCVLENNNHFNGGSGYYGYGGAVFWWASNGLIINCTFKNNCVARYGGAVYTNGQGTKTINCLFKNNSVIRNYSQWEGGGAIFGNGKDEVIENCTFINNSAPGSEGGALKLAAGSWSINYNKFFNNTALFGNNIHCGLFDIFNGNIFYINSISDINASAFPDYSLELFDKNTFIVDGNKISKQDFCSFFESNKEFK